MLYSCSTDKTIRIFDMENGVCSRKYTSHKNIVNSIHPARRGPALVVSGSDDGTILVHDLRSKEPTIRFTNSNNYQVTAVTFNDTAEQVISAGIDNTLKIWDLRRGFVRAMSGHEDTITSLSLSPDGR
jgi:Prp8 binding protein